MLTLIEHVKDPVSLQNLLKKEEPANHPTAEVGSAGAQGNLEAAEDSPAVAGDSLEVAEGSPVAADIVRIAECQDAL